MKYALISVFDKTGITDFADTLHKIGYKIISTAGTAQKLQEAGIPVTPIQEITGNPESFDGRMKTISFQIESGILYDRSNPQHQQEASTLGIKPIDIVICNLYPFEKTPCIENIDVGGPTMVRAAAKNFKNALVVIDPLDYPQVIQTLKKNKISLELRKKLAAKAFTHLAYYDAQIARFLNQEKFPEKVLIPGKKALNLRYGENPHQNGALYFEPNSKSPLVDLKKHWGRDLSLVNVTDIIAGIEAVCIFEQPAAVVIKHNTPCGIALGKNPSQALKRAINADPISAFGGVIVLNKSLDAPSAIVIAAFKDECRGNIDIVATPYSSRSVQNAAIDILKKVRKSMGIYTFGSLNIKRQRQNLKWIDGGFILQDADDNIEGGFQSWQIVTKKKPNKEQLKQMQLAWKFVTRIKSNAVIVVDKKMPVTRGIGSGQTSRVAATHIALEQAQKYTKGAILASDAFFPFDDSVKLAAKYRIGAIVQQGGSINDRKIIKTADEAGIPMVFTNRRAFWH